MKRMTSNEVKQNQRRLNSKIIIMVQTVAFEIAIEIWNAIDLNWILYSIVYKYSMI